MTDQSKFQFDVSCDVHFDDAELAARLARGRREMNESLKKLHRMFLASIDAAVYALMMAGHKGAIAWQNDAPNTTARIEVGEQHACTVAVVPERIDPADGKLVVDVVTTWHPPFEGMAKDAS